jgi:regulator of cell morphogenesis and NO signaling
MEAEKYISEIVRNDYRTADVFNKWGISYCCGGNRTLAEVCRLQQLDQQLVERDLADAVKRISIDNRLQFDSWPTEFLADYILYIHHAFAKNEIPALQEQLARFVKGHSRKYPQLTRVEEVFNDLAAELLAHMEQEETFVFRYMKQICHIHSRKEVYGNLFVRTLSKPLQSILNGEHRRIGLLLAALRTATQQYRFPADACTTCQVLFRKMKALDDDLTLHKHLENNLLYPRALQMEKELLESKLPL